MAPIRLVGSRARADLAVSVKQSADVAATEAARALRASGFGGFGLFITRGVHSSGAVVAHFPPLLYYRLRDEWPTFWVDNSMIDVPSRIAIRLGLGKGRWVAAPALADAHACRARNFLGPSANQADTQRACNGKLVFRFGEGGELNVVVVLTRAVDARDGRVQVMVEYGEDFGRRVRR